MKLPKFSDFFDKNEIPIRDTAARITRQFLRY